MKSIVELPLFVKEYGENKSLRSIYVQMHRKDFPSNFLKKINGRLYVIVENVVKYNKEHNETIEEAHSLYYELIKHYENEYAFAKELAATDDKKIQSWYMWLREGLFSYGAKDVFLMSTRKRERKISEFVEKAKKLSRDNEKN